MRNISNMETTNYKRELHEMWDEFWLADGEEALKLGAALVEFLRNISTPGAEDYYLWGLSIYSLNQNNVLENSHPYFIKSLEKDDEYYLARLYSAHCFHDKGEYANALEEYLMVDQCLLKQEIPIWRWVKLLEQIGFCYAMQDRFHEAEEYFEKVINAYSTMEKNSLVPAQEAYECLESSHNMVSRLRSAEDEHFRT